MSKSKPPYAQEFRRWMVELVRNGRNPKSCQRNSSLRRRRFGTGESPEDVVRVLGFNRTVIYEWLTKYREGGLDALPAKAIPGRPARLDGKQLRWLYKAITSKNPSQYQFEFAP